MSNAIGGIAAQTMFLALADLAYRKANLEHAAACVANMLQASLLMMILAVLILAIAAPPVSLAGVHPVSPLLFVLYFGGLVMIKRARENPMWFPKDTDATEPDEPDHEETRGESGWGLWGQFAGCALITMAAGYFITGAVSTMVDHYGWLRGSAAGTFMTAVATSLPELVTSIVAVRRGALQLAVGGIIGGNCFDTLFAGAADFAFRDGSIFHAAPAGDLNQVLFLIATTIAMTALLLSGLLFREKRGVAGIGFESLGVIGLYALMAVAVSRF